MHLARADLFVALPADPLELVTKAQALGVGLGIGPFLRVDAGKNARRQHRGGIAGALFVGPVGHDHGVFRLDPQIVHRAQQFQPAQHTQHAVILAACGLRIQMRPDVDRQRIGVGAIALREHVAHRIKAHGAARLLAPFLEQGATFGVFVGQRLAIVATRHTGADLGHLHQTVPQTIRVDLQVFTGRGHSGFLCVFYLVQGVNFYHLVNPRLRLGLSLSRNAFP